jgi:hypothetical protein
MSSTQALIAPGMFFIGIEDVRMALMIDPPIDPDDRIQRRLPNVFFRPNSGRQGFARN